MSDQTPSKGEITRSQILDVAYKLFMQNGYAGTSMRQIANACELTVGGIYGHFSSKEDIWVEVFEKFHPYHEMAPSLLDSQGETAEEWFRDAAIRIVKELEDREDIFNLMMIELVEFNGKHIGRLATHVLPTFEKIAPKYARFRKDLRSISPINISRAFAGLFFSYYVTDHFIPGVVRHLLNREKALGQFIDIFLFGILADSHPSRSKDV